MEIYASNASSLNGAQAHDDQSSAVEAGSSRTALVFVGLAIAGAAVAFAIVRGVMGRRPADPTTERIQQLIDEANRLLKQLDEKQPSR